MTLWGVPSQKAHELRKQMEKLDIFERDIRESFVRSSGPGGQNVNKVATCVILRHLPTGICIKSQQERSQGLNRYQARYRLIEKITRKRDAHRQKIVREREKSKRQKRKRSKASKERILESKRLLSQKKSARRKISSRHSGEYLE